MARLNRIWRCNTISFTSKFMLYKSLVTSIFLYGCVRHGLRLLTEKRVQPFETKCLRIHLRFSYLDQRLEAKQINFLVGPQESLPATTKKRKRAWFGHVTRRDSLFKTLLQDTLEGAQRRGRQRQCWMNNIRVDIPAHARTADKGLLQKRLEEEMRISAESSLTSPWRLKRSRD